MKTHLQTVLCFADICDVILLICLKHLRPSFYKDLGKKVLCFKLCQQTYRTNILALKSLEFFQMNQTLFLAQNQHILKIFVCEYYSRIICKENLSLFEVDFHGTTSRRFELRGGENLAPYEIRVPEVSCPEAVPTCGLLLITHFLLA